MMSSVLAACGAMQAFADDSDPSTRIARLAYVEGSISFQPAGSDEWVTPPINRPLTTGDQLWSDRDGRAELELDGSSIRLAADTEASLLNLSDTVTQIQLSSGTLLVRVRRLEDNETYEIDTPNLAFTVLRPGLYRIAVDSAGQTTALLVRRGQGEVTGAGSAFPIGEGDYRSFTGSDDLTENPPAYVPDQDAFDRWSAARDARWDQSVSASYVSADVVGYEDLDDHGTWTADPEYGHVWIPRGVESGWAPYHSGHWAYIAPWGYTWVDDNAWGFAPFHYGRWVTIRGSWAWIPAPPRRSHAVYVRPVYAPALVAWVGGGGSVAWFALGPREVYVPSYHVSPRYVRNINVSNTNVNTTVINNIYNTTIINKQTVNATYVNRDVPGAVAATTSRAFTSAEPVARNRVRIDPHAIANAPVGTFAPASVPTKQAVLGSAHESAPRPPTPVQSRSVVARIAPPAARANFVKIAPPARLTAPPARLTASPARLTAPEIARAPERLDRPLPTARMVSPQTAGVAPPAAAPPPVHAPSNATHPNEMPPLRQPPSPAIANSVLEREHLQEQQRQQAQQNADRARLQQAQEAEHQRAARQAADTARQHEVELQHQAQTQQLAERHAQEQQQLQARQQEQRRQQEAPPVPKTHRPESSAVQKP